MTVTVMHIGAHDADPIPDDYHGLSVEQEVRREIAFYVRAVHESSFLQQGIEDELHQLGLERKQRPGRLRGVLDRQISQLEHSIAVLEERRNLLPRQLSPEARDRLDDVRWVSLPGYVAEWIPEDEEGHGPFLKVREALDCAVA